MLYRTGQIKLYDVYHNGRFVCTRAGVSEADVINRTRFLEQGVCPTNDEYSAKLSDGYKEIPESDRLIAGATEHNKRVLERRKAVLNAAKMK